MKLIDGDALIAWIKESQQMTSKMKAVVAKIKTMPSADRQQGYWINDDGAFRCTICGEREDAFIDGWDWEVCGTSKFCPSCGARMKGADNDN